MRLPCLFVSSSDEIVLPLLRFRLHYFHLIFQQLTYHVATEEEMCLAEDEGFDALSLDQDVEFCHTESQTDACLWINYHVAGYFGWKSSIWAAK